MSLERELRAFYEGKIIVVTGGAGAIGSNLTKKLVDLQAEVVVVDDLSSGFRENIHAVQGSIRFVHGDVAQLFTLFPQLPKKVDVIFHLAAFFANQNSVEFPERDLETNGRGTLCICRWACDMGVDRLVFSSSSCVYGAASGEIDEDVFPDPHTPYAMTKVLGEQYVKFHREYHGLDAVVLRYFNSYGPGELPGPYRNVIPNFVYRACRGEPLPLTGSGRETRDFTFVEDVVYGTLLAGMVKEATGEIFNIGTGRETRIEELAVLINEIAHNEAGCEYLPRRDWDRIRSRRANIDRARRVLGYEPRVDLRTGIERTFGWFKKMIPSWKLRLASVG